MKNFKKMAMCLIAMMMTFAAYASDQDLYGRWVQNDTENGVVSITSYEFLPDGALNMMVVVQCPEPKVEMIAEIACAYTFKDKTITIKCETKDIDITKFEVEGLNPAMLQMAIEQQKQQIANQTIKLTNVRIDGDTMSVKFEGDNITLQKVG